MPTWLSASFAMAWPMPLAAAAGAGATAWARVAARRSVAGTAPHPPAGVRTRQAVRMAADSAGLQAYGSAANWTRRQACPGAWVNTPVLAPSWKPMRSFAVADDDGAKAATAHLAPVAGTVARCSEPDLMPPIASFGRCRADAYACSSAVRSAVAADPVADIGRAPACAACGGRACLTWRTALCAVVWAGAWLAARAGAAWSGSISATAGPSARMHVIRRLVLARDTDGCPGRRLWP